MAESIANVSTPLNISLPASVAQLDVHLTGDPEVVGLTPPGLQHSFVEI